MKARLPKGYGRPDPQAMMRQVQKMQDEIRAKQDELEAREYTGTASGEMVTVTMTGKHEVTAIKIKPEAVDAHGCRQGSVHHPADERRSRCAAASPLTPLPSGSWCGRCAG